MGTLIGPGLRGITVLAEAITDLGFPVPDWAEEPDEVLLGCGLPTALNHKGPAFEIGERQCASGCDGLNGSHMVLQPSRQADALTRRGLSGRSLRFCFADIDRCLGSADRRVVHKEPTERVSPGAVGLLRVCSRDSRLCQQNKCDQTGDNRRSARIENEGWVSNRVEPPLERFGAAEDVSQFPFR